MPDILGAVNGAIELVKKAMKASEAIKNSDLKLQMADLMSQLAEVKVKCSELVSENDDLKKKIKQLESAETAKPQRKGETYFFGEHGPWCTACWDGKGKQVLLKEGNPDFKKMFGTTLECPVCHNRFK